MAAVADSLPDNHRIVAVDILVEARNLDSAPHTAVGAAEGSNQAGLAQ